MKKRIHIRPVRAVSLLLAVLLLAGCQQQQQQEPKDELILPSQEEPASTEKTPILPEVFTLPYDAAHTLDPITCEDGMQQVVGTLLYEGLFAQSPQQEPENVLCSSYSYDAATFTYTFTLRSGAAFWDGTPLTASHVAAALNRAKTSARYSARLRQVRSVSGSGETVTVTLTAANTGFPALLDIPIVKSGTETDLVPVGTGPYRFDSQEICLVRNESWWNSAQLPTARIALSNVKNRDLMLYQFQSHDIQLITADLTGTDSVSATGNTSYQDAGTTVLQYVGCNTSRKPFDDPKLRQALSLGIDRSGLISAFLSGHGTAVQFPVPAESPLYPAELETVYSHDDFGSAMAEAGFASGHQRSVTLLVNEENSFKVSAATYVAECLSDYDLQVTVRTLPWEQYTAALSAGNFDLYYGEVKLTADWNLSALLGSGGGLNYGRWSDAATDELLAAYAAATDRTAAMKALCAHLQEQSPILPVCFKSVSVMYQSGTLENLTPTAVNPFYGLGTWTMHLLKK